MRVALFATGAEDAEMQADVVGFVSELLRMTGYLSMPVQP